MIWLYLTYWGPYFYSLLEIDTRSPGRWKLTPVARSFIFIASR